MPGLCAVISEMRRTYTTPESMKKHMSLVRSKIIQGGHYSEASDLAVLLCTLTVVSGRRSTELLNGRSTFLAVPEKPTLALLQGQLQTKSDTPRHYVIPLCCHFDTFSRGLDALRTIHISTVTVALLT